MDTLEAEDQNDLPTESWGVVGQRKILPEELRDIIESRTKVIRVSEAIDAKIRTKHLRDIVYYEQFTETFSHWQYVMVSASDSTKLEIYARVELQWVLAVIGQHQGSSDYNLVSLCRVRPRQVMGKRETCKLLRER